MIDVLKYKYHTAVFSIGIVVVFAIYALYLKQTRGYVYEYSVDFDGGTQVLFKFDRVVSSTRIHAALEKAGWHGVSTREFSDSHEVLVRVKEFSSDTKELAGRITEAIRAELGDVKLEILQSGAVGPSVGATLRWQSFAALMLGLLVMLIYIAVRFWSMAFALGAVVSLFHDAIVVMAVFLFLGREVSTNLIMAVLTLLGYSINDTIVIFSRIRENIVEMKNASIDRIVTTSINQTLRRTILTSAATTLAVIAMFVLGGDSLRDLSLALLVGIIFGTYSSIYMASPVMMLFYRKRGASA